MSGVRMLHLEKLKMTGAFEPCWPEGRMWSWYGHSISERKVAVDLWLCQLSETEVFPVT